MSHSLTGSRDTQVGVLSSHIPSQIALKKHHKKPFRRRHLLFVAGMYVLSISCAAGLGIVIGKFFSSQPPTSNDSVVAPVLYETDHYQLSYERDAFKVVETVESDGAAEAVVLRPHSLTSEGRVAASQLKVAYLSKDDATAFSPQSDELFAVSLQSQQDELLGGTAFVKSIYEHQPLFSMSAETIYSVQWVTKNQETPIAITVEGLIGSPDIPSIYQPVFASLQLRGQAGVMGSSITKLFSTTKQPDPLPQKYIADKVSPAVVKIYNIVCGVIALDGQPISQDGCNATVGSGFFVSSDGYIATNGHVVVYEPEDAFVQMLFNEPQVFVDYLRKNGLNDQQIAQLSERSDLVAAVVATIYELPEDTIELQNRTHHILVAHGDDPLRTEEAVQFRNLTSIQNYKSLKQAKLIAADYSSRDIYVVSSGSLDGFSSSDVALLKVEIDDAPYIDAVNDSIITQNQAISVLGFPSDAENALIDNNELAVTITNGSIGSIRVAAGGDYKLFQSDADASQGNSGGPAITADGQVFGLLTYRFKNDAVQDAAKSYIRDFNDIKRLALQSGVSFNHVGDVQANWERGLEYYADGYYSTALEYFESVQADYPSHRLADDYIAASKFAIANGQDVRPTTINILAIGFVVGALGAFLGLWLILRHHARHKVYSLHFPHLTHHA